MKSLPEQNWATTPERGHPFLLRFMARFSLLAGRRATRGLLYFITLYFLLFSPKSRRASLSYLELALGRKAGWKDAYRHFLCFASTVHDRIYLLNRRFDLFSFEIHGADALLDLLSNGNGLFLVGAHLGSFEAVSAIGKDRADLRVAMLMHEENAQKINAALAAINPQSVNDIIGLGSIDAMLKVQQRLEQGCAVGMLADRTPGKDALCPVCILGKEAHLPEGPFRMAALLKRPVVFMAGLYLGGNRYAIHFEPLADFSSAEKGERKALIRSAIERYALLLETYCRKAPYNWFNFFDFWKETTP
jgi:predicted LPLAT superfamily acyltransferase